MAGIISEYSPNIRWGKQHLEVVLTQWAYTASFNVDVGGNCTGFDVLEAAVFMLDEKLDGKVELTNQAGDILTCEDENDEGEEWLKRMIVSIRIIGWTPPSLNEIRAMNGAKPLPDGDRPWEPQ